MPETLSCTCGHMQRAICGEVKNGIVCYGDPGHDGPHAGPGPVEDIWWPQS